MMFMLIGYFTITKLDKLFQSILKRVEKHPVLRLILYFAGCLIWSYIELIIFK